MKDFPPSMEELKKERTSPTGEAGEEMKSDSGGEGREDERLSPDSAENGADKMEKKRLERQERKARQRMQRAKTDKELDESRQFIARQMIVKLNARIGRLEHESVVGLSEKIRAHFERAVAAYDQAELAIKESMDRNDSDGFLKASRLRDSARSEYDAAARGWSEYQEVSANRQQNSNSNQNSGLKDLPDPRMVAEYRKFQARNPWYDLVGRDVDSARVQKIDEGLFAEGTFDPNTPEYFSELDKRVRRALPHRFEDDEDMPNSSRRRNGPPVNGNRGGSGGDDPSAETTVSQARLASRVDGRFDGRDLNGLGQRAGSKLT